MNGLICGSCSKNYPLHEARWKCDCGGILDITFPASFPIDKIKNRKPGLWRYREAIPLEEDKNIVSFGEGFTPIAELQFQGKTILFKQEQLFSTGSYKDRGATVMISKAKELGVKQVVEDSSGNAGCAVAAYCAQAGIECDIYVPAGNSPSKLIQITSYGARLYKIPGTREDTAKAVTSAAEKIYYASHYWNPFFFHGTKTFAFEVCEQLGWKAPDTVILPAGHGTLLLGSYIGFSELRNAGIIEKIPKLIGVQSEQCNPLSASFKNNPPALSKINKQETLAEGIAIAEPLRWKQILQAVHSSGGMFIEVSDEEIKSALKEVIKKGFYIEPTSAAAVAAVKKYASTAGRDELIVSAFSGHGLKASDTIGKILG